LEEAGGAGRTAGTRVEGGFDFSEPDEFGWNFLGDENGFEARDVGFGGGGIRTFGKFFDPDLAFELGWGIGKPGRLAATLFRRRHYGGHALAGFGFGRGNFDAEFVGDVEVIEAGLEPECVRQSFFVMFEEWEERFGADSKGGEVDDVFALKFFLDVGAEFFDFLAVGVFENAKGVVIEVFVGPLFSGLEEVVESEGVSLGGKEERKV
jgi:hypothetical protein